MVTFNSIPSNARVPLVYVEFDASRAVQGPAVQPYKGLLIGQRLASGTVLALVPKLITSVSQAISYFGRGSELAAMAAAWLNNNDTTELWAIGVADPAGAKATSTLTVTGTPTEPGTLHLYIGGRHLQVAIATGDAVGTIATAIAAAVNADADLPVVATSALGVATLTARHFGVIGNEIDVRLNYSQSDRLPAGSAVAVVAMSGGTGDTDISGVWDAIGEQQYNVISVPVTDTTNLASLETELRDRWGPIRQNDGVAFTAHSGSHGTVVTFGLTRNSPHVVVLSTYKSPTPTYELASMAAGLVAKYGQIDPARPFQTLIMEGAVAPALADRFTVQERNILLHSGIATTVVGPDGSIVLERMVTTYQLNQFGGVDPSYLDVNTPLTLSRLRYDFRNRFATRFPRAKLANDGVRYAAGSSIVTPSIARGEAIALASQWVEDGFVEDLDQFKADLVVERSKVDTNRLEFLLSPNLVNQYMVTAAQIGFLL